MGVLAASRNQACNNSEVSRGKWRKLLGKTRSQALVTQALKHSSSKLKIHLVFQVELDHNIMLFVWWDGSTFKKHSSEYCSQIFSITDACIHNWVYAHRFLNFRSCFFFFSLPFNLPQRSKFRLIKSQSV